VATALGAGDLVLCSGTLSRHVSFVDRVAAAVAGGFAGISLWGRDYAGARSEGWSDTDLRAVLAGNGLAVAELDPLWSWLPGAAEVVIPRQVDTENVFGFSETDLFGIADALGARSVNAVDVFGGPWSLDQAAGAFADLCDRAGEHGLLVHLEFLPWSRIPDLATAWQVVDQADRQNGGVAIDAWHYFRSDPDPDPGVLGSIPGAKVLGIQLDDAPAAAEADLLRATLHERLLPGHGELDLSGLVDGLRRIGARAPFGVEVFSDELHALPAAEAGRRAGQATRELLAGPSRIT
jgi:sugar phosphate isomerase/epimerase